jgi:hypothetical protein
LTLPGGARILALLEAGGTGSIIRWSRRDAAVPRTRGDVPMSTSLQLRFLAIAVLFVLAVLDAVALYFPIVALGGIILLLIKPKWLFNFFARVYNRDVIP